MLKLLAFIGNLFTFTFLYLPIVALFSVIFFLLYGLILVIISAPLLIFDINVLALFPNLMIGIDLLLSIGTSLYCTKDYLRRSFKSNL